MADPPVQPLTSVTTLLMRAQAGDGKATTELLPLVYDELRNLAQHYMSAERAEHTLQPTALVHEAFMRMVGPGESSWENRRHFFGAASKAMRRILLDHARTKKRIKRGEGVRPLDLKDTHLAIDDDKLDIIALDEALQRLSEADPGKGQLVELRFFGGLSMEEVSEVLRTSLSTVNREWRFVRAWLHRELAGERLHD